MGQVLGDTDSPKWPDVEREDENERGGEEEGWERMKKKKKSNLGLYFYLKQGSSVI